MNKLINTINPQVRLARSVWNAPLVPVTARALMCRNADDTSVKSVFPCGLFFKLYCNNQHRNRESNYVLPVNMNENSTKNQMRTNYIVCLFRFYKCAWTLANRFWLGICMTASGGPILCSRSMLHIRGSQARASAKITRPRRTGPAENASRSRLAFLLRGPCEAASAASGRGPWAWSA